MLRLSDIAQVRRGFADPPQPHVPRQRRAGDRPRDRDARRRRHSCARQEHQDARWPRSTADLPLGIEPTLVADQAVTVESAISEFMASLWQAVAIILAVSFISLGVRPGLVIALSIPLTLAIVFSVMDLAGIDMQRISLGALIIALALARRRCDDDDRRHAQPPGAGRRQGCRQRRSRSGPTRSRCSPARLVTIAGFVPVGFAASSAGEYTFSLFAVVSIALIVSWFVAVMFAPLLGVAILKPPKAEKSAPAAAKSFAWYRGLLTRLCEAQVGDDRADVGSLPASILAIPLVPNQFFPSSDRPELLVDLRLPQNASIYASEDMAERFDAVLKGDPDVARWSTYVGRGAIRFYLPLDVQLPNDFFAQAVIVAKDVAARERLREKLEKVLANDFPSVVGRVSPLELGPPVGWPVQYRVSGPDIAQVREIALELAQIVAANDQTEKVNFDWIEPAREVRIHIDQDEARLLGAELAIAGIGAQHGHLGVGDHTGARRHLSRRRRRARDRRAAVVAGDAAHTTGSAAERAHRPAQPVRDVRIRARPIPSFGGATGSRP